MIIIIIIIRSDDMILNLRDAEEIRRYWCVSTELFEKISFSSLVRWCNSFLLDLSWWNWLRCSFVERAWKIRFLASSTNSCLWRKISWPSSGKHCLLLYAHAAHEERDETKGTGPWSPQVLISRHIYMVYLLIIVLILYYGPS